MGFPEQKTADLSKNVDAYLDAFIAGDSATAKAAEYDAPTSPRIAAYPSTNQRYTPNPETQFDLPETPTPDPIRVLHGPPIDDEELQQMEELLTRSPAPPVEEEELPPFDDDEEIDGAALPLRSLRLLVLAGTTCVMFVLGYGLVRTCTSQKFCGLVRDKAPVAIAPVQSETTDQTTTVASNYVRPRNAFREAVRGAQRAVEMGELASSKQDWDAVAKEWLSAIRWMKEVPESSPKYLLAQEKAQEYTKYLATALKEGSDAMRYRFYRQLSQLDEAAGELTPSTLESDNLEPDMGETTVGDRE